MSSPAETSVAITYGDRVMRVVAGTSVAAALLEAGVTAFRESVRGERRGPLCGMGICHECRVTIDGHPHRRACLVTVREGMHVASAGSRTMDDDR